MSATSTIQAATVAAPIATSPTKKKSAAGKSATPAHPSTAVMVIAAISELKEKKGSSLSAIKKYMSNNYNVDSAKLAPFIRKYLKSAVGKGSLVQTNGIGAMGHFKLPVEVKKKKKVIVAKKPSAAAAKKKLAAKKPAKASIADGTLKKRKKVVPSAAEPAAKKPKTVAAVTVVKPKKKSLVKAKKAVAAPKPPKVKKTTAVKQTTKTPKKK